VDLRHNRAPSPNARAHRTLLFPGRNSRFSACIIQWLRHIMRQDFFKPHTLPINPRPYETGDFSGEAIRDAA